MQDGDEADAGTQVPGIDRDLQQRLSDRLEQHAVDNPLVGQRQCIEGVGQRENDVEVLDGQQFGGAIFHPPRAGGALAAGAVPVAAGVVSDALMLTVIAGLHVPAQRGGATRDDRTQNALLLAADVAEPMPVPPDDLCQFQRRSLERWHHGVGVCSCA